MQLETLNRAYQREKAKRAQAESLLEDKSRELFLSYEKLRESHDELNTTLAALKLQQKQLVQSEKMASLGIISAGVAHEINNPIGFVLSNITTLSENIRVFSTLARQLAVIIEKSKNQQLCDSEFAELAAYAVAEDIEFLAEDGEALIAETIEGIVRVRDIVDGLKSFARTDSGEREHTDINACIETTLKLLSSQTKYSCQVETNFGDLPILECYTGKLKQVFMNLIVNATQAVSDDGIIKIETSWRENCAYIKVSDNGKGIAEADKANLFTPFFTTKPVGQGTGLGLSISLGIVEEHGGEIQVASELGKGTTFTVILPGPQAQAAAQG